LITPFLDRRGSLDKLGFDYYKILKLVLGE
jgi:hypothetical protein